MPRTPLHRRRDALARSPYFARRRALSRAIDKLAARRRIGRAEAIERIAALLGVTKWTVYLWLRTRVRADLGDAQWERLIFHKIVGRDDARIR